MARLKYTLIVTNPDTFESEALLQGTDPPQWAKDLKVVARDENGKVTRVAAIHEDNYMSADEEMAFIAEKVGDKTTSEPPAEKPAAAATADKSYAGMTVTQLQELIEGRNARRNAEGGTVAQIEPPTGRKQDLIASLEADDLVNGE